MTIGQMQLYLIKTNLWDDIRDELLVMDERDLDFVFDIILPNNIDFNYTKKEVLKWQQLNQDTMRR